MSTYTENYNLTLPEQEEYYDVGISNQNFATLDGVVGAVENTVAAVNKKMGVPSTEGATIFSLLENSNGSSLIKSIQRVTYTVTTTSSTSGTVNINTVDPDKCFVLFERLANYSSNGDIYVDYALSETSLTVYHNPWGSIPGYERFLLGFWIIEFN